jgi:hypothetical protein
LLSRIIAEDFESAVLKNLSDREELICLSFGYQPVMGVVRMAQQIQSFSWMTVVLTNVNFRFVTWKEEKFKSGAFSRTLRSVPIFESSTVIPLANIVSCSSTTARVNRDLKKLFQKELKQKVEQIFTVELKMSNGTSSISSPYIELKTLSTNLEAALSGSALARNTNAVSDALTRLSVLKSEGIITEEEFERAKSGFIGSSVEVAENSVGILRQLHSLLQSGVLSESEFNMKKWDILSKKI